jgi:hypothetical protein
VQSTEAARAARIARHGLAPQGVRNLQFNHEIPAELHARMAGTDRLNRRLDVVAGASDGADTLHLDGGGRSNSADLKYTLRIFGQKIRSVARCTRTVCARCTRREFSVLGESFPVAWGFCWDSHLVLALIHPCVQ